LKLYLASVRLCQQHGTMPVRDPQRLDFFLFWIKGTVSDRDTFLTVSARILGAAKISMRQ
jgi:hypothetical protein